MQIFLIYKKRRRRRILYVYIQYSNDVSRGLSVQVIFNIKYITQQGFADLFRFNIKNFCFLCAREVTIEYEDLRRVYDILQQIY